MSSVMSVTFVGTSAGTSAAGSLLIAPLPPNIIDLSVIIICIVFYFCGVNLLVFHFKMIWSYVLDVSFMVDYPTFKQKIIKCVP